MKGILTLLILSASNFFYSQCNPDPIYADSAWGIWPNPTDNFPPGDIGEDYSETINFKIPEDASLIDSVLGAGQTINSIELTNVSNVPPGLSYSCDVPNCTWLANSAGCAVISGIPDSLGSYVISLDVIAYVETFFGPFGLPYPFDGYVINIGPVGFNSYKMTDNTFKLEDAFPNPTNQSTTIQFVTGYRNNISFKINNLLGDIVHEQTVFSKVGVNQINLITSLLKNGVYLYSISDGINFSSKRLIVNH